MTGDSARAGPPGTRFRSLLHLDEVTSTNDVAAEAARSGAPEGTVVVAEHQSAGRGRRGRSWESPPGSSLLLSVVLRPAWPPEQAHVATLAVAVAARAAAAEVCGVSLGLKWPNDLVTVTPPADRKVAGILAEGTGDAVVVGIGVNVRPESAIGPGRAALDALAAPERRPVDRDALLASLLRHLDRVLTSAPESIVAESSTYSVTVGRHVRIDLGGTTIAGRARGMSVLGHLEVDTPSGPRVVAAGDVVHLRPDSS